MKLKEAKGSMNENNNEVKNTVTLNIIHDIIYEKKNKSEIISEIRKYRDVINCQEIIRRLIFSDKHEWVEMLLFKFLFINCIDSYLLYLLANKQFPCLERVLKEKIPLERMGEFADPYHILKNNNLKLANKFLKYYPEKKIEYLPIPFCPSNDKDFVHEIIKKGNILISICTPKNLIKSNFESLYKKMHFYYRIKPTKITSYIIQNRNSELEFEFNSSLEFDEAQVGLVDFIGDTELLICRSSSVEIRDSISLSLKKTLNIKQLHSILAANYRKYVCEDFLLVGYNNVLTLVRKNPIRTSEPILLLKIYYITKIEKISTYKFIVTGMSDPYHHGAALIEIVADKINLIKEVDKGFDFVIYDSILERLIAISDGGLLLKQFHFGMDLLFEHSLDWKLIISEITSDWQSTHEMMISTLLSLDTEKIYVLMSFSLGLVTREGELIKRIEFGTKQICQSMFFNKKKDIILICTSEGVLQYRIDEEVAKKVITVNS